MRTYDKIRLYLLSNNDRFVKISEVSEATGLSYSSVKKVLQMAWSIGWVQRKEYLMHNNGLNNNLSCMRTSYKINNVNSWKGLYSFEFKAVLENKV